MASKRQKKSKSTSHRGLIRQHSSTEDLRHKDLIQHTSYKMSARGRWIATTSYIDLSKTSSLLRSDHDSQQGPQTADPLDVDQPHVDHLEEVLVEPEPEPKPPRKRTDPFLSWLPEREAYLGELLALEGRGHGASDVCSTCRSEERKAVYECLDCICLSGRELQCKDCLLTNHRIHPLHRIREWNGVSFVKRTLKDLGLRVQLGHPPGERCILPKQSRDDDFTVIDTSGIHAVGLDFCNCERAQLHTTQLLRYRLYPATSRFPRSATTFRALEAFELLAGVSKVSSFEYYKSLARLSDDTGADTPPNRYPAFLLTIRQWRELEIMKRSAQGHDPSGPVAETMEGESAMSSMTTQNPA
ncbi:hypothetical protein FPV67DRAFT_1670412 [Lyophyllum atratum]|nr:hypothetical protein FPV67DRAFT_1670412 [Lyophyllum atratum]